MGKIRKRTKLHSAAPKNKVNTDSKDRDVGMDTSTSGVPSMVPDFGGGMFSKLDIDINALKNRLPDDLDNADARSSITNKTFKDFNLTKKEKRNLKHHVWLKKVDALKEAKQQAAAKKRREKTAIVGDMKPLEDTLPTLELLLKDHDKQPSKSLPAKPKPVKKEKTRKKQMLEDYALFQQVTSHPVYRENPLATIKEHLQNRMKQEDS